MLIHIIKPYPLDNSLAMNPVTVSTSTTSDAPSPPQCVTLANPGKIATAVLVPVTLVVFVLLCGMFYLSKKKQRRSQYNRHRDYLYEPVDSQDTQSLIVITQETAQESRYQLRRRNKEGPIQIRLQPVKPDSRSIIPSSAGRQRRDSEPEQSREFAEKSLCQNTNSDRAREMQVVKNFTKQITGNNTPNKRLSRTKGFVDDVRAYLSSGGIYDACEVAAVIEALLRVVLDEKLTDIVIRDYVISLEVCQVVQSLITGPVTASDILRGMMQVVRMKGVGFDGFVTWCAELVNKWLVRADNTVCPTSPGFVIELFKYFHLCNDRQKDICSHDIDSHDNLDSFLFPLVRGALLAETAESMDWRYDCGNRALHHAATAFLLPQVTEAILSHAQIDPNVQNYLKQTALTKLVSERLTLVDDPLPTARVILAHPGLDVSVLDNDNHTALDRCLNHLGGSPDTVTRARELLRLISQHPSCTSAMIQGALERLVDWEVSGELRVLYTEVVTELASNVKYDINMQLKESMTLAHIAATYGHGDILLKVMDIAGFDPKVQDEFGNTLLYYACEHLPRKIALKVIDTPTVLPVFSHKNCVNQTVFDYYRRLPGSKRDPIVMGRLEQKFGHDAVAMVN